MPSRAFPAVEVTGKPPAEVTTVDRAGPADHRTPHDLRGVRWSAGPARSTVVTSAGGFPVTSTAGRSPGWAWNDVLPHFIAIETDLDIGGPLHGSDGPILVRRVAEFDGCTESFVRAVGDAGYRWISDLNGSAPAAPLRHPAAAVLRARCR